MLNSLLLLLAHVLMTAGLYFLSDKGSFTQKKKHHVIASLLLLGSVLAFIVVYGTLNGIVLFLAMGSIIGFCLCYWLDKSTRH
ncbi:MAG: hypothetical protein AAGB12_07505 [Pseudomonadota bacterium]